MSSVVLKNGSLTVAPAKTSMGVDTGVDITVNFAAASEDISMRFALNIEDKINQI